MQRHNRRILVSLICAAQLGFLLGGVIWFTGRLARQLDLQAQQHALEGLRDLVDHVAAHLATLGLCDLSPESAEHQRLAQFLETADPSRETAFCLVRPGAGEVCGAESLIQTLALTDATARFAHSGATLHSVVDASGYIAMRALPEMNAVLIARQIPRSSEGLSAQTARGVRQAGMFGAILLAGFSALATLAITNRYESKLVHINQNLELLVERRSHALRKTRDAVIFGLAKLAESRDDDTGEHLDRIRVYTRILAEELAALDPTLTNEFISTLGVASSLHDIGKVGVPDAVLLKEGPLTPREREIIEYHPLIGGDCLLAMKERLGDDDFLETACEIAFGHHERWDGTGYPFGLSGEQIPLAARIVALADVYDALTTKRSYKPAFSHEAARRIILDGRGKHFDPRVVDAFLATEARFRDVSARHAHAASRPALRRTVEALEHPAQQTA